MLQPRRCFYLILAFMVHCTAPVQLLNKLDYTKVNLSYDRSLCGRSPLPFWFHLTQPEISALQNSEKAKTGDPETLLSLALIASGNVRNAEAFNRYHTRVSQFVEKIRPAIDRESDFREKGRLLYKLMRKEFFVSDSTYELAGYTFGQSQLSVVFENGSYNCISSAMLYCILARWFGMQVDGVVMRGHAFAQLTAPDGEIVEVETTSRNGYGWIHDEEFYRKKAVRWFNLRDISNQTYEDYLQRQIVKPYQLIAHNMKNQHTAFNRMDVEDVHRIIECRAYIDDTNTQFQKDLITTYQIELSDLHKKGAIATIVRFYRTIAPRIELILNRCGNDSTVVASARQLCKHLLMVSDRGVDTLLARDTGDEAGIVYGLFTEVIKGVSLLFPNDAAINDLPEKMSAGFINRVSNRILDLIEQKKSNYAAAHFRGAESFVEAQTRLFPDNRELITQRNYFQEKKQMLLFAEKNFPEFSSFTRNYIGIVKRDTAESIVLFRNALYTTFRYIAYCVERNEFERAEELIDIVSAYTVTDTIFARNIQWALGKMFHYHFNRGDWAEAIRIAKKQIAADKANTHLKMNSGNIQICYQNWAAGYYNDGNWLKARETLVTCINDTISLNDECSAKLRELEKEKTF